MSRSIFDVAVSLLARREHSSLEIRQKLKQRHFSDEEIEPAIEQLQTNNLLSDERFTESYINMRKQRGYGPLRIAQELKQRGINAELMEIYLDRNDPCWHDILQQQYIKKYGNQPADEYKEKARRTHYLQNRGFPLDWVFKLNPLDQET
jgi:regulatory protein